VIPPNFENGVNIFTQIRQGDLLVHHPSKASTPAWTRFITAAADDPKVLAIKMNRLSHGDDSPFIHTLIRRR